MAMTLVETVTVGSGGAASIEFTNIPQTGKDLLVVASVRSARASNAWDVCEIYFNSDTANRTTRALRGSGSATNSFTNTRIDIGEVPASTATANTFANGLAYISNYTGATAKSVSIDSVGENNATEAYQYLVAGLWNDTDAITSIIIRCLNGNIVQYGSASLYIIS